MSASGGGLGRWRCVAVRCIGVRLELLRLELELELLGRRLGVRLKGLSIYRSSAMLDAVPPSTERGRRAAQRTLSSRAGAHSVRAGARVARIGLLVLLLGRCTCGVGLVVLRGGGRCGGDGGEGREEREGRDVGGEELELGGKAHEMAGELDGELGSPAGDSRERRRGQRGRVCPWTPARRGRTRIWR